MTAADTSDLEALPPAEHTEVFTLVLTGGPSAGKTSAVEHLKREQDNIFPGRRLLIVPEAATLYFASGARLPFGMAPSTCGRITAAQRNLAWEMVLNELKRTLESQCVCEALKSRSPSIVLCDRGVFDSRAYLASEDDFLAMMHMASWDVHEFAPRYDHVFHIAKCPEHAYMGAENNAARRETYAEASALDQKLWDAWDLDHAAVHTHIDGPNSSWPGKLQALVSAMQARLDSPVRPCDKQYGWWLPPDAVVAMADAVASAPNLSRLLPTVFSIIRRANLIDQQVAEHSGGADDDYLDGMSRNSRGSLREPSMISRDVRKTADVFKEAEAHLNFTEGGALK